jgi:hypothetical protein
MASIMEDPTRLSSIGQAADWKMLFRLLSIHAMSQSALPNIKTQAALESRRLDYKDEYMDETHTPKRICHSLPLAHRFSKHA